MVGAGARRLEPRHIRKVRQLPRRLERGDEVGEFLAILRQQRRARRMLRHELPRHRGEEFAADQPFDDGIALCQRSAETGHDVVAVHGKASRRSGRGARGARGDAGRKGRFGAEQRLRKGCFEGCGHGVSHAAATHAAPDRMRWAATASARSTGQSGTSLSHSIRVGSAPVRAIT